MIYFWSVLGGGGWFLISLIPDSQQNKIFLVLFQTINFCLFLKWILNESVHKFYLTLDYGKTALMYCTALFFTVLNSISLHPVYWLCTFYRTVIVLSYIVFLLYSTLTVLSSTAYWHCNLLSCYYSCTVLYCNLLFCSVLYCTGLYFTIFYCTGLHVLLCTAIYIPLYCTTVQYYNCHYFTKLNVLLY